MIFYYATSTDEKDSILESGYLEPHNISKNEYYYMPLALTEKGAIDFYVCNYLEEDEVEDEILFKITLPDEEEINLNDVELVDLPQDIHDLIKPHKYFAYQKNIPLSRTQYLPITAGYRRKE